MTTPRAAIGVAILLSAAVIAPSYAGVPMITDDPWTRDAGQVEINVAYVASISRQTNSSLAPLFSPNYNITDNIQVTYAAAYLVQEADDEGMHSGLSNSLLSVKWRFLDQDRDGVAMSITPRAVFNNPTSSVNQGLVESGTVATIPLEVGRTFGPVTLFSEVGYQFVQHDPDRLFLGIAGGYNVTERVQLLAEIFTLADADFRDVDPITNFGFAVTLSDDLNLLFSIGRSLRDGPDDPWLVMYAGLQWHF